MKIDTSSSTRSIYNVLRNKANGIVYSASDCPLGRMDAPHFIDHHTCACAVVIAGSEVTALAIPPASAGPPQSGPAFRTSRPNCFAAGTAAGSSQLELLEGVGNG